MRRATFTAFAFLLACGPMKQVDPPVEKEKTLTTYRIISGVSMGGIGSAALGLTNPQRFDGVAPLGGPMDAAFFTRMTDQFLLGGFCTKAELEAIMATGPTKLNDPAVIRACSKRPATITWEHSQDFNHWHVSPSGGWFDRDTYLEMVADLLLANGNMFTDNPNSPFAPAGVDPEKVRAPAADFCTNPAKVTGLKNAEYNPDGTYTAITFCDGEPALYYCLNDRTPVDFCSDPANIANPIPYSAEQAFATAFCATKGGAVKASDSSNEGKLYKLDHGGAVDPCRQPTNPVRVMLAYDYNNNGRRDYGEPLVNNGHERFDDVGADGCADALEDGSGGCGTTPNPSAVDPNHDNFDPATNVLGTELNFKFDTGEPFRDFGLDGVANTHDTGEGNGTFDMTTGWKRLFANDARTNFSKLDAKAQKRLNIFSDGGIRDIFNLGLMAKMMFSAVRAVTDNTGSYRNYTEIPGMLDRRTMVFNPWNALWKTSLVPRNILMNYGLDNPTDDDRLQGEGDHVGTAGQAVYRFSAFFNWAAATWPSLERPTTKLGGSTLDTRQRVEWFQSSKLNAKWEYGIALPPGYDDAENANARYPVVYMLHGYGMDPQGFLGTSAITELYATDTDVKFRPMIFVFPNGRCCFVNSATGEKDCRGTDDTGADYRNKAGWVRECNSGTFWVNRAGFTPTDGTLYGDAFFELMDHVDQKYRTLAPQELEAR